MSETIIVALLSGSVLPIRILTILLFIRSKTAYMSIK